MYREGLETTSTESMERLLPVLRSRITELVHQRKRPAKRKSTNGKSKKDYDGPLFTRGVYGSMIPVVSRASCGEAKIDGDLPRTGNPNSGNNDRPADGLEVSRRAS